MNTKDTKKTGLDGCPGGNKPNYKLYDNNKHKYSYKQANIDEIFSATNHLNPSCDRERWVKIGMAIKSELSEEGFQIWDRWSSQGSNYNESDAISTWKSIKSCGGVTIKTLFAMARQEGWRPDNTYSPYKPGMAEIEARRRAEKHHQEELRKKRETAYNKAADIIRNVETLRADHPYLMKKGLDLSTRHDLLSSLAEIDAKKLGQILGYVPKQNDIPLSGRVIVAPIHIDCKGSSLEFIDEAGRKSALAGGAKSGGYCAIPIEQEEMISQDIIITEGIADILTALYDCTPGKYLGYAALSCGNMEKLAVSLRKRARSSEIIIVPDLDDAGYKAATKAAEACNGRIVDLYGVLKAVAS